MGLTNATFPSTNFLLQPPQQDDDVRGPSPVGGLDGLRDRGGPGPEDGDAAEGPGAGIRIRGGVGEASHCQVRVM